MTVDKQTLDELRINQGAAYSPNVSYAHSLNWTGWGYLGASVEVPPAKLDTFFREVDKIAADLKVKPPSADELQHTGVVFERAAARCPA